MGGQREVAINNRSQSQAETEPVYEVWTCLLSHISHESELEKQAENRSGRHRERLQLPVWAPGQGALTLTSQHHAGNSREQHLPAQ